VRISFTLLDTSHVQILALTVISTSRVRITVSSVQGTCQDSPYNKPSSLPQVKDFCQYVQQAGHTSIGFCLDEAGTLRAYPTPGTTIQYADQCLTLDTLLQNSQVTLPLKDLYVLAITLVTSVFQLSHTPWLDHTWNKKDIAFLRASNTPLLAVDLEHAYLIRDFDGSKCNTIPAALCTHENIDSAPDNQSSQTPIAACSNFLALAILLLELTSGKSIEHIQREEGLGNEVAGDGKVNLLVVNRWYKEKKPLLSAGFSKAILTCLQEYLNPDASFDNLEYCSVMKENILQPLEDEMQLLVYGAL
jgi:hypothetical protein